MKMYIVQKYTEKMKNKNTLFSLVVISQLRQLQHLTYDNRLRFWVSLFVLYSLELLYTDILIILVFQLRISVIIDCIYLISNVKP